MLKGLLIRQVFLAADWVLILLLIAGACLAATQLLGVPLKQAAISAEDATVANPEASGALAAIKPRGEYDVIVNNKLFGSSAIPQTPKAEETGPKVEPTKLKLKLCGTSATSPRDLYASAIILDELKNQVGAFCVGQEVVEQVTLEEVYQRKVILLNKKENRREVLSSEEEPKPGDTTAAASGGPSQAQPSGGPTGGNRVTLKKQEFVQDLVMNYADIVTQIKPELYHDAQGNVAGITASNLESIPIAQKLGVKDGDVLQSVNNEPIDSEQKIMELVNKYRNSSTFRIGLLRDGKPVVVTYKLE